MARLGGQRRQRHPARGQGTTSRCCWPSSAGNSTRTAADGRLPADRVPARGTGEDRRRLRGQPDLRLPRLRTVQGYDFHGGWETVTNHQSNRVGGRPGEPADFSIDGAVNASGGGAPRAKLVVGIPFYRGLDRRQRRRTTGCSRTRPVRHRERWRPASTTTRSLATWPDNGFQLPRTSAPAAWLFDGTTFWTFDDPTIMKEKAPTSARRTSAGSCSGN